MSAPQDPKPTQADTAQPVVSGYQGPPTNAPSGPRSQSRGGYPGNKSHNQRQGSRSPHPYNNNHHYHNNNNGNNSNNFRNRSSSTGNERGSFRGNFRGDHRGGRGAGGGYNVDNGSRYRSSSGGSPYPGGYSSSGGSRSGSRGPQETGFISDFNGRGRGGNRGNRGGGRGNRGAGRGDSRGGRNQSQGDGKPRENDHSQKPPQWNPPNRIEKPKEANEEPVISTQIAQASQPAPTDTSVLSNINKSTTSNVSMAEDIQVPAPLIAGPSSKPELAINTNAENKPAADVADAPVKKGKRNRPKKKNRGKREESDANVDDADNEGTSGSEDASASPVAIRFGTDLVTASIVTPETTITMIPVPGNAKSDLPADQGNTQEPKASEGGNKEAIRPMLEEYRRKDSRFSLLPTRRELTTAIEQMEVYTVVVHSRAANEVVNTIKKITDNLKEGVPDCQHLRRLVKPENLPPSLTGLPDSLFIDYSTENQSPSVKVNPDGTVETVARSRGASRAQRRRRNASYRKGEKPLYVLLCPVVAMTIRELYEILSPHPLFAGVDLDCEVPFDSQDIPQIIKHTVPQWAPCNLRQSNSWTEKYWPTIYRRTNPYGPHPFLTNKWEDKLHAPYPVFEMDYVEYDGKELTMGEYYMRLARKVAEEGEMRGAGLRIGCVVVELKERDGPRHGRVMAVAHDARTQANNPLAHACYRAISLVGRKRVEVTARHKPKVNMFSLNGPNSPMEDDYYDRVPGDPDGYLMNDLVVFMTHEPCVMCSMAMVHSRIGCLVYSEPMVSGGLHADLAPAEGHSLPFRGVTDEDVTDYRRRHGIPEPDNRQRRTTEGLFGGGDDDAGADSTIRVKLPVGKGKGRRTEGQTKEQFMKEQVARLKKEWAPIDPSLKTDEAIIEACKDKAFHKEKRKSDISFFQALRRALLNERDKQEADAKTQARIAATKEVNRKGNTMDKATQTAKIFDSINDGEDYLGSTSNVKIGTSNPSKNTEQAASSSSVSKENMRNSAAQTSHIPDTDPSDNGKFAQTCDVFDNHAKNMVDGVIPVKIAPKFDADGQELLIEGELTLTKSEGVKGKSSREHSPEGFGGLGNIDIVGVNEDRTLITTGQNEDVKGKGIATNISTEGAERGRSRIPAPFKPGTGDFVAVNVSYGSPDPQPSGSTPDNDFTTSGGEETAGTGCEEDSDLDVGAAFDLMTVEVPDTAEGDGEKKKKKKKKKRSRKKKATTDENATPGNAEGFEIVEVNEEGKEVSTKEEATNDSNTHGSSTNAQSIPSLDVNEDENTGTALPQSRPGSPNAETEANNDDKEDKVTDPTEAKKESEEDLEPDELVRPTRPFRLLEDKTNPGVPKYDHNPGDGYGLFWREKLNWKFLCFRYKPTEDEEEWNANIEWQGATNDRLHA
ncbi:tRNA-specific adenosine deaminase subunit tad3 [Orbilia oligospora]|uniref:tRNA-specific adenosine deaminase subunit tad3 n=1 Tax=Orbilia oligospora TaxID=2813651 RepID=A0A7C8K2L5_ORBOL|nr:tRNA-specific adenosine deaminase subunit tad3 [Orbilia oligospora]KAF3169664.1 tRNA-specific adenosine deaminase subunit tad3 [Orbilia oligospora]KAF3235490.1 tRNA-specific adenosine deaminase subunit tad3 [Orbilia oligospora]KAF3260864.1 tRNA-specific adenosine deaminase subunit tad3 [Orbilia oligospora]KAF3282893.1 tRNA-specific adenosine deaminase subunit tad3 [Orbilia oligospora]